MRRPLPLLIGAALALTALAPHETPAQSTPITVSTELTVRASKPVKVAVFASNGLKAQCDSYGKRVFAGWVDPGHVVTATMQSSCVCYMHTYTDFPSVNWSTPVEVCPYAVAPIWLPQNDPTVRRTIVADPAK